MAKPALESNELQILSGQAAAKCVQEAFDKVGGDNKLVVQLGDVGTGALSGSPAAFETARLYLQSFKVPVHAITGNHDLEGTDFDDDEENLAAWEAAFKQSHYWARDVGPCVLLGLSTTRYRSNVLSHHEVHIDEDQMLWFDQTLRSFGDDKPVLVFTHAPPLGCGLKVLNELHIKNRCLIHLENTFHVQQNIFAASPFMDYAFGELISAMKPPCFRAAQEVSCAVSVAHGTGKRIKCSALSQLTGSLLSHILSMSLIKP